MIALIALFMYTYLFTQANTSYTLLLGCAHRMPLTPVTAVLFDPAYVQLEYPVLAARLRESHSDVVVSDRQFQPECAANKCTC